jgi:uncharacterized OB-fold protein
MATKTVSVGKIDVEGLKSVGKGALIAGAGAVLTYLVSAIPGVDFGAYTPMVVAVFGIGVNFLRKLLTNYESKQ